MEPIRLLGIIEIAGSFQVNITKNEKYGSGHAVGIGFILVSKEEELISDIVKTLQGLNISSKIKDNKLIINGIKNILRFNEFITNYNGFVSETRKFQFKQFEKIVEEIDCEQHHFSEGIKRIQQFKTNMKNGK